MQRVMHRRLVLLNGNQGSRLPPTTGVLENSTVGRRVPKSHENLRLTGTIYLTSEWMGATIWYRRYDSSALALTLAWKTSSYLRDYQLSDVR